MSRKLDLCMDTVLDNKMLEVELRKEEDEEDGFVQLSENSDDFLSRRENWKYFVPDGESFQRKKGIFFKSN